MGILSSMNTGITGVKSNGEALSVIADNLANANTYGFKTSRVEFQDVIAKTMRFILGGNQIGRGTKIGSVTQVFSQGSVTQTERPTDLAISGDGFFVLKGKNGQTFTRNGAFNFDKEGNLVNSDGFKLMGFRADENGDITTKLETIRIERNILEAKQTEEVKVSLNLDIREQVDPTEFSLENPEKTAEYSTGISVYDSAGNQHALTMYFDKTADNTWNWYAVAKGDEIAGGQPGQPVIGASGTLTFDADGKLLSQTTGQNSFSFANGARPNQQINFDFGDDITAGGTGMKGSTQYGAKSDLYKHTQDGYTSGAIGGLSFNDDGILSAFYTNGVTRNVAQVALAKFENNEGLLKAGNNLFRESLKSGQPNIGAPQNGGRGRLFSKSIEQSTSDIATEFVNLIQMQRAFQASARTMTSSDELMQEVLNMKRG